MSEFTRGVAQVKRGMNHGQGSDDLSIKEACSYVSTIWGWHGLNHPISATVKLATPDELLRLRNFNPANGLLVNEALRMSEVSNG